MITVEIWLGMHILYYLKRIINYRSTWRAQTFIKISASFYHWHYSAAIWQI